VPAFGAARAGKWVVKSKMVWAEKEKSSKKHNQSADTPGAQKRTRTSVTRIRDRPHSRMTALPVPPKKAETLKSYSRGACRAKKSGEEINIRVEKKK